MEKIFKAKIFMSDIASNVRLVTIIKEKLNKDVVKFKEVATGRETYLSIKNKDYKYNIYNIYGPVSGKLEIYIHFLQKTF